MRWAALGWALLTRGGARANLHPSAVRVDAAGVRARAEPGEPGMAGMAGMAGAAGAAPLMGGEAAVLEVGTREYATSVAPLDHEHGCEVSFLVASDAGPVPLTRRQALEDMQESNFADFLSRTIITLMEPKTKLGESRDSATRRFRVCGDRQMEAAFVETLAVNAALLEAPFKVALIDVSDQRDKSGAPLRTRRASYEAFATNAAFAAAVEKGRGEIAQFDNLKGTCKLFAPTPEFGDRTARTETRDLAQFLMSGGSTSAKRDLWKKAGHEALALVAQGRTVFLNAHGDQVPWCHVRLDFRRTLEPASAAFPAQLLGCPKNYVYYSRKALIEPAAQPALEAAQVPPAAGSPPARRPAETPRPRSAAAAVVLALLL